MTDNAIALLLSITLRIVGVGAMQARLRYEQQANAQRVGLLKVMRWRTMRSIKLSKSAALGLLCTFGYMMLPKVLFDPGDHPVARGP